MYLMSIRPVTFSYLYVISTKLSGILVIGGDNRDVTIKRYGHDDTISNSGQVCLQFILLGENMHITIFPQSVCK